MTRLSAWSWELTLLLLTIAASFWAASLSPFYLDPGQILYSLQQALAVAGLLSAGMMMVIVCGEIDISLPAILALGTILLARASEAGAPLWLAFPGVLLIATGAGLLNGVLVTGFGLPSLAVTLGTTSVYRALALWIGGPQGHAGFPDSYVWLGSAMLGALPVSLLLLAVALLALASVMHLTVFGRRLYMVGSNAVAMAFSGERVSAVKIAAFGSAGAISGLAALVYVGQFESARADNANDILLFVVAAVTLGGVDVFGGRGRVAGVALALLLLGTLKNGMGLANLAGPVQTLVIGALLVGSVAIPQARRLRNVWLRVVPSPRLRRHAPPAPASERGAREEWR